MERLHVSQAYEQVRVERKGRRGHEGGNRVSGPLLDHGEGSQRGQGESGDDEQIVNEHRRAAEPADGCGHQCRHDQGLGVGERVMRRIEDVSLKQVQRIARQLVLHPGEDPLVQHHVAVVMSGQDVRRGGQRPRVHDGQQRADEGRRGPWGLPPTRRAHARPATHIGRVLEMTSCLWFVADPAAMSAIAHHFSAPPHDSRARGCKSIRRQSRSR